MLEPKELEQRRARREDKKTHKRHHMRWLPVLVMLVTVYVIIVSVIPLASLKVQTLDVTVPSQSSVGIPWPKYGQAAIGAAGFGLLSQYGDNKPLPIASVAKVITALAVLKAQPIYDSKPMPVITITAQDVATYKQYSAEDQSVVPVELGEQLTEYQALQALLLPSANNMADVLVRWAFGSNQNYLDFVNPFTKTLGMTDTHIADASGYSPQTVSTSADLIKLAEIAMNSPTIAEIVAQPQADLPVAGTVHNVNRLVGHKGVIGIKTGNTDEAGGCYLFSAKRAIDTEHTVTLVGVIMDAPDLSQAIDGSLPIIDAAFKTFSVTNPVHSSQIVGYIQQTRGKQTELIVGKGLTTLTWDGQKPVIDAPKINHIGTSVKQGDNIGYLNVAIGSKSYQLPLVAAETIPPRSYIWRLQHAAGYL